MRNEEWLINKYNELCKTDARGYCFVSLKIKRFRIFNRLYGREGARSEEHTSELQSH